MCDKRHTTVELRSSRNHWTGVALMLIILRNLTSVASHVFCRRLAFFQGSGLLPYDCAVLFVADCAITHCCLQVIFNINRCIS